MSKSYRKSYIKDGYGSKWKRFMKRYANRVVRNTEDIPNGRAYRKIYCSYNICDYCFYVEVKRKDSWNFEQEFWKYARK